MLKPTVFIAADHAGVKLKSLLCEQLKNQAHVVDLGPVSDESVDYPDYADLLCKKMETESDFKEQVFGILICGSGIGMSIRANRFSFVRAALCLTVEMARLARAHNHANVLCLASRLVDDSTNLKIVEMFLATSFEGGRHERRVQKL